MIRAVLDAYRAAVRAKDADAFAALYAEDVVVYDTWGAWSYTGRPAWHAMAKEWFASLGDETVAVEADDVRVHEGPDVATLHAFLTYRGLSAEGKELRAMQNRLTWVLVREGGKWLVAHEHTSAPADFATAKLKLSRDSGP